jgi:uncharacterized protein with HEPN domain
LCRKPTASCSWPTASNNRSSFTWLVILGEAAVALAKVFQEQHPEVPWPRLISLRNRLVHAYFDLDTALVWGIATTHLDELRHQLQRILDNEFPAS